MKNSIYRADHEFCPGDVFRQTTVDRAIKFYPILGGTACARSPRHILLLRHRDGTFSVGCCDHQFSQLDVYPVQTGVPDRQKAMADFDRSVSSYHADPRWSATL